MSQILRLLNASAEVSEVDLLLMAEAIQTQLARDLGPAWGLLAPEVVSGDDGQADSDWVMTLSDATDPGVLGYHTDLGVPNSVICVGEILGYGGSVLQNAGVNPSVSSVVSHEAMEMTVDPLATMWEPRDDGTFVALEVADPAQGWYYNVGDVAVADFVTPPWFLASSLARGAKVDFLGLSAGGGKVSPEGYIVVKAADGSTSSVFGEATTGLWVKRARLQKKRPVSA